MGAGAGARGRRCTQVLRLLSHNPTPHAPFAHRRAGLWVGGSAPFSRLPAGISPCGRGVRRLEASTCRGGRPGPAAVSVGEGTVHRFHSRRCAPLAAGSRSSPHLSQVWARVGSPDAPCGERRILAAMARSAPPGRGWDALAVSGDGDHGFLRKVFTRAIDLPVLALVTGPGRPSSTIGHARIPKLRQAIEQIGSTAGPAKGLNAAAVPLVTFPPRSTVAYCSGSWSARSGLDLGHGTAEVGGPTMWALRSRSA